MYAHGNEILDAEKSAWPKPRQSLQQAARVLAVSEFTAGLVRRLGVEPERITVLHPGCDVERFRPLPASSFLREQLLQHHSHDRVILTVGNLVPRKGHDMVIKALPRILHGIPNAVYLVVGDGPYRGNLERLAVETGVRERVVFAGRRPNEQLAEIYALADVFAMPSRMQVESCDVEGFGLVYLEANACGKVVVAGRCGGAADAVVDGVSGLVVDPRSPEDIAESIGSVLASADLASRLGEQGRRRVLRDFTWERFADPTTTPGFCTRNWTPINKRTNLSSFGKLSNRDTHLGATLGVMNQGCNSTSR